MSANAPVNPLTPADTADLDNRFNYHPATPARGKAHEAIRDAHRELADTIYRYVAPGRERATAITNLEQSMFWANAGIARE